MARTGISGWSLIGHWHFDDVHRVCLQQTESVAQTTTLHNPFGHGQFSMYYGDTQTTPRLKRRIASRTKRDRAAPVLGTVEPSFLHVTNKPALGERYECENGLLEYIANLKALLDAEGKEDLAVGNQRSPRKAVPSPLAALRAIRPGDGSRTPRWGCPDRVLYPFMLQTDLLVTTLFYYF
jgi:hypothetical protein